MIIQGVSPVMTISDSKDQEEGKPRVRRNLYTYLCTVTLHQFTLCTVMVRLRKLSGHVLKGTREMVRGTGTRNGRGYPWTRVTTTPQGRSSFLERYDPEMFFLSEESSRESEYVL